MLTTSNLLVSDLPHLLISLDFRIVGAVHLLTFVV